MPNANKAPLVVLYPAVPGTVGDRRCYDRRRRLTFLNWRHLGFRARRQAQRRGGNANTLVDVYESRLLYIVLAIMLLSCADAFFTLQLLQLGAVELNTFMAILIERDLVSFVGFKLALTGLALVLIVIYKNFRIFGRIRVSQLLWLVLFGYSVLILYELVLLYFGWQALQTAVTFY